jgi:hypothetical protein
MAFNTAAKEHRMASMKGTKGPGPRAEGAPQLIEFTRHIGHPASIRRAPGQRVFLTSEQVRRQGLVAGDYIVVKPDTDRAIKRPDAAR